LRVEASTILKQGEQTLNFSKPNFDSDSKSFTASKVLEEGRYPILDRIWEKEELFALLGDGFTQVKKMGIVTGFGVNHILIKDIDEDFNNERFLNVKAQVSLNAEKK